MTEAVGNVGSTEVLRRVRSVAASDFSTVALHRSFECHVTAAQDAFLKGDCVAAEREATMALRLRPTAHLFAFLAVIAESKAQFDRASDFRLLQAFLARDVVLWEELLYDFLSDQRFYKAVVCLQRLSALEKTDKMRYRMLQLQLADLLIGLGEIRRARTVLESLWIASRCRDFEVFALLSSLYFQLGKWASLQRLISSSLKHAFQIEIAAAEQPPGFTTPLVESNIEHSTVDETKRRRVSKRVRFFGGEDEASPDEAGDITIGNVVEDTTWTTSSPRSGASFVASSPANDSWPSHGDDDFDFDGMTGETTAPQAERNQQCQELDDAPSSTHGTGFTLGARRKVDEATESVRGLYGERIRLETRTEKRNFLTLVNVHTELLNESGKFAETVRVVEFAAACLQVPILELPPDLLVRLGTAYAFLGDHQTSCTEVFRHLLETCEMEEYGDALYDAAVTLQKVGLYSDTKNIYETLARYHAFSLRRLEAELAERESKAQKAEVKGPSLEAVNECKEECEAVKTVLATAYYGIGLSDYCMDLKSESEPMLRKALELDPSHLQARLLLGKLLVYDQQNLPAAVQVLTPREGEPALQRVQLGAALVDLFHRAKSYIEAIALGVSIFEMILSSAEDGDAQSVAPGSVRRAAAPLLMPTLSRASSAIMPATTLATMVGRTASVGSLAGGAGTSSVGRLSFLLATSIRSGSSVFLQKLARRGRSALTTTAYGASAAASVAAGCVKDDEMDVFKDSSTIFSFRRRRQGNRVAAKRQRAYDETQTCQHSPNNEGLDLSMEDEGALRQRRKQERVEAITQLKATDFWCDEEVPSADVKEEPASGGSEPKVPASRVKEQTERRMQAPASVVSDRDCGLTALETYYRAPRNEESNEEGDNSSLRGIVVNAEADVSTMDSYELPSLEEISKQFNDPVMADVFLQASSNLPSESTVGVAPALMPDVWNENRDPANDGGALDGATAREVIGVLGRAGFMGLAVAIVECYSALGKFTEAKEFASLVLNHFSQKRLFRQMGNSLERPLRVAVVKAALAAGESEDAYRVGLRLLQEDAAPAHRTEVVELLHGVLNRCEDRSSILYRAFVEGMADVPLMVLLANRYYQTRSYTRVLNLYLVALQSRPQDIFLNFMVGLLYYFCSHQKKTRSREACVSAGTYYLSQYQSLIVALDPSRSGEALYNAARALHFLRLHYLCVPLYERVAYQLSAPSQCSVALQRAAKMNLYFIYRWDAGNRGRGLAALQRTL